MTHAMVAAVAGRAGMLYGDDGTFRFAFACIVRPAKFRMHKPRKYGRFRSLQDLIWDPGAHDALVSGPKFGRGREP